MLGEWGSAGLRPAPAEARSRATASWLKDGGVGPVVGTLQVPLRGPAQPLAAVRSGACEAVLRKQSALTHVSSVAACSCALSCAHGKTGVGRPAQPARGMPRAHAAHAPSTGPPRLRQFPAAGSRSTPCVDETSGDDGSIDGTQTLGYFAVLRRTQYPTPNSTNHTGLATSAWRVSACRLSSTSTAAKNTRQAQHMATPPGILKIEAAWRSG